MPGPHKSVALTRLCVRYALNLVLAPPDSAIGLRPQRPGALVVGVSGGADSLALAAAVHFEAPKLGFTPHVVIVDHALQPNSDAVAQQARNQCVDGIGYAPESVQVRRVEVASTSSGPEADARDARYQALRATAAELHAQRIILGHTGNDQAEQVLLGLIRGSGTRSLAGIRVGAGDLLRPFLLDAARVPEAPVMRTDTEDACAALGLQPWADPHNESETFTRVRARKLLQRMENDLVAPGVTRNLVRTASHAARDADFLDEQTEVALARAAGSRDARTWPNRWPVESLAALAPALRIRALRRLLVLHGARDSELASHHLYEVEKLLTNWRGQGPIQVPGSVEVERSGGEVAITSPGTSQWSNDRLRSDG